MSELDDKAESRHRVLGALRRALAPHSKKEARRAAVEARLRAHPRGPIPGRGQLDRKGRIDLFVALATSAGIGASLERIASITSAPAAIAAFLRSQNLPMRLKRGSDPRLAALPWHEVPTLEVATGASDGNDIVGLSCAFAAVAESGTLVMISGADNPTTLNFLPETQIVLLQGDDVAGDYEAVWDRLRLRFGTDLPRAVNWVTGPSRSADIEQQLVFGAHGPRRLHILLVD